MNSMRDVFRIWEMADLYKKRQDSSTAETKRYYKIFEFEIMVNVDSASKYMEDRGYKITVPLRTYKDEIPKELLRHYWDKSPGHYKIIGYKLVDKEAP